MSLLLRLRKIIEAIGVLMFAGMFVVFIAGVTMRYVFGRPLPWSDEVCVILLLWSMFWVGGFVTEEKEHASFDLVYSFLPEGAKRGVALVAAVVFGGVFLYAFPATYDYIAFLWREVTPALRLPLSKVYFCFTLFMGAIGLRMLWKAWLLLRNDWRKVI